MSGESSFAAVAFEASGLDIQAASKATAANVCQVTQRWPNSMSGPMALQIAGRRQCTAQYYAPFPECVGTLGRSRVHAQWPLRGLGWPEGGLRGPGGPLL